MASYLADVGNGVTLVFGKSLGKIPDIYVLATCREKLELEVKTPESLRNASNNLSNIDAEKVINNAIKSSRGQTSRKYPAILAIGGFHLTTNGVDNIERAAQAYLNKSGAKKTNLAAISICNITYILNEVEDQQGHHAKIAEPFPHLREKQHIKAGWMPQYCSLPPLCRNLAR